MISLAKFLTTLGIIFAILFAIVFSLATFIEPHPRDMSFPVRADKFIKPQ